MSDELWIIFYFVSRKLCDFLTVFEKDGNFSFSAIVTAVVDVHT